jgi:hypothetical protein
MVTLLQTIRQKGVTVYDEKIYIVEKNSYLRPGIFIKNKIPDQVGLNISYKDVEQADIFISFTEICNQHSLKGLYHSPAYF